MEDIFDVPSTVSPEPASEVCSTDSMRANTEERVPPYERQNVNLDDLDFSPVLNMVEQLLAEARLLANWTDDGEIGWLRDEFSDEPMIDEFSGEEIPTDELGHTGIYLLQQIAEKWGDLHCAMVANGLWENWAWRSGDDERRHAAVRCLDDLHRTVFKKGEWVEILPMDHDPESGEAICYRPLPAGTRLGIPHAAFVKQLTVAVELLREIVGKGKSRRKKMTVEEANAIARKLTDTTDRKKDFFALSEKKQAKRIGCSWGTWSKTDCFRNAVEVGWLPKRKNSDKRGGTPPSVVSLTDTLAATVGVGEQDEIVHQLAVAENDVEEKRQWKDLISEEQRALLAEHEAEVANEPSPLESRPRKVHNRRRP